jgi:hypothetical protein
LNPDQNNRYCEVEIVYTDEGYGDQDLSDLISMISHSTEQESETATETDREATIADDEQPEETVGTEKEKRVTNRAIVREYREISKNLVAMGDSAFFPVEHAGKLFQPLPAVVYSRHGGDQSRSTLARVPKVLHDYLAEAATTKKPTAEELERLRVAQDVTISYIPFR